MSFFDNATIESIVDSEYVSVAACFLLDLSSGPLRYTEVLTGFTDAAGRQWQGVPSGIVSFEDISFGSAILAPRRNYILDVTGLLAVGRSIVGQENEYRGREITQYMQFFNDAGMPVSEPVVAHTGIMDLAQLSVSPSGTAKLTMTTETDLSRKNKSSSGYYTDTDQNVRFPGDLALERVKVLALGEVVKWPDF